MMARKLKVWTDARMVEIKAMLDQGKTRAEIAAHYGVRRDYLGAMMRRHAADRPVRKFKSAADIVPAFRRWLDANGFKKLPMT